jgi:uncharacterized membrane-anchored protein YhcB (DUF1043 family)
MSSIVYIAIAFVVGIIAGPTVRTFVANCVSEVKEKHAKEVAALQAQADELKTAFERARGETSQVILDLKTDLSLAESKVAAFTSLFPSATQQISIAPPTVTVPEDQPAPTFPAPTSNQPVQQ